jgi:hypothetical protein
LATEQVKRDVPVKNKDFSQELYISKCLSTIPIGHSDELEPGSVWLLKSMLYITERTDLNAVSTLDMLSAEVSIYIMPLFTVRTIVWQSPQALSGAVQPENVKSERTGKLRGYFGGDNAATRKCSEVCLISDEHGDDMWACVMAQLFDPGLDVAKGRGLCDVIQ